MRTCAHLEGGGGKWCNSGGRCKLDSRVSMQELSVERSGIEISGKRGVERSASENVHVSCGKHRDAKGELRRSS
eukprot:17072-Eustigmatos_ZCMA.PRE.1